MSNLRPRRRPATRGKECSLAIQAPHGYAWRGNHGREAEVVRIASEIRGLECTGGCDTIVLFFLFYVEGGVERHNGVGLVMEGVDDES